MSAKTSKTSRSFLFSVSELPINDNPADGGTEPITDRYGHWEPPVTRNGFQEPLPGKLYRYHEGTVSLAPWSEGVDNLRIYRKQTIFWCNGFLQFLTVPYDASQYDVRKREPHRWLALQFRHSRNLSRIDEYGPEKHLACRGSQWITDLGLGAYVDLHLDDASTQPGGLSGNLAILIGLIAFSCPSRDLETVLLQDRAWHGFGWHGHSRGNGRQDERGVVVNIYRDPQGSKKALEALEWNGPTLLM